MLKGKNNSHMYNQAHASNACAIDLLGLSCLKELFDNSFFNFVSYPMIYFKVMSFYLTRLHLLMNHRF